MTELFAILACVLLLGLAVFQLLLIIGKPLGEYAWGGSHRVLPSSLRLGSAVSIILYGLFGLIILDSAGLWDVSSQINWGGRIWLLTVYFAAGVVMNAISRSKRERAVMTPVAVLLFVSCLVIALY